MTDEQKPPEEKKPENKLTTIRNYFRSEQIIKRFEEAIGKREALPFISSVLLAVSSNEKLMECTPQSIAQAAMRAATLRLTCDPSFGYAYIIPRRKRNVWNAVFTPGYKGMKHIALRQKNPRFVDLNVATVYEGQIPVEDQIRGRWTIEGARKNYESKPIGYMLYYALSSGFVKTFYMSIPEIEKHAMEYAKENFLNPEGPWKKHFVDMCEKTVLRQGLNDGALDPIDAGFWGEDGDDDDNSFPDPANVTVPETRHFSTEEAMNDLGYDDNVVDGKIKDQEETAQSMEAIDLGGVQGPKDEKDYVTFYKLAEAAPFSLDKKQAYEFIKSANQNALEAYKMLLGTIQQTGEKE